MDSHLPSAGPRRVIPDAPAYSIVETQPRSRRSAPWRALLALLVMTGTAATLWVLIGMAAWRLFH
jgi:hypothetical protein